MASAYGRSRGLLCRVEEGGGEEEKARGDFYKWIVTMMVIVIIGDGEES